MSSTLFRRRTALLTVGFAAAASLALTACGTGEDTGAQHAPNTAADTRAAASGTDSVVTVAKSDRSTTTSKTATGSKATKGTKASSAGVTCTGANTKVTAQTVTRPLNHMLLTVKNTGSKTCYLYGYPALRFQDAQAVPRSSRTRGRRRSPPSAPAGRATPASTSPAPTAAAPAATPRRRSR